MFDIVAIKNIQNRFSESSSFLCCVRYWEEASVGRDFVIILTCVVLYQVILLLFISNLSCFKSVFCLFPVSVINNKYIVTVTFSIFFVNSKLILHYSSSLSRLAWSSLPSSTRSTLTLKKPQSSAWCSTLGASPAQSQRLTYQVAGSFALVMKWRKFTK